MMTINRTVERAVKGLFPGATFDILDGQLWIRTQAWQIDSSHFIILQVHGIIISSILIEGESLVLVVSQKCTKSILK